MNMDKACNQFLFGWCYKTIKISKLIYKNPNFWGEIYKSQGQILGYGTAELMLELYLLALTRFEPVPVLEG